VSGPDGHIRADALAVKLREAIGEGARVTKPVKFGEITVSGLDPAITPMELIERLASLGECGSEQFRLGPIRRSSRGMRYGLAVL